MTNINQPRVSCEASQLLSAVLLGRKKIFHIRRPCWLQLGRIQDRKQHRLKNQFGFGQKCVENSSPSRSLLTR